MLQLLITPLPNGQKDLIVVNLEHKVSITAVTINRHGVSD
jgi:hypothetical protein